LPYQTALKKEKKSKVMEKSRTSPSDTGSPEVQVSLITSRINELTEHMRVHQKDFSTQRGLLKLVGQRRRMLNFLRSKNSDRYLKLIQNLELRK
jgi:small subunit ribosomal protein S15